MESMRSLNTSLPRSPPHRRSRRRHNNQSQRRESRPTGELLSAFKAAALSVTQLYKTAASAEDEKDKISQAVGYQDALDDLLDYLDQENLGLGDGEGWRVREWATQRHAAIANIGNKESEDASEPVERTEHMEEDKRARSESPTNTAKETRLDSDNQYQGHGADRPHSLPPSQHADEALQHRPSATNASPAQAEVFHFRSPISLPMDPSMEVSTRTTSAPVRVEVIPRQSKSHAHGRYRHGSRDSKSHSSLGHSAGAKRKIIMDDFFDLSGINGSYKDLNGNGGAGSGSGNPSKKGRFA